MWHYKVISKRMITYLKGNTLWEGKTKEDMADEHYYNDSWYDKVLEIQNQSIGAVAIILGITSRQRNISWILHGKKKKFSYPNIKVEIAFSKQGKQIIIYKLSISLSIYNYFHFSLGIFQRNSSYDFVLEPIFKLV